MPLTDLDICETVASLYDDTTQWDKLWQAPDNDGVCCALKHIDDLVDLVVFRGSRTIQDWMRDFLAVPQFVTDLPALGPVHAGFMLGMENALNNIQPSLGKQYIVAGHSLGAARAALYAAMMKAAGRPPARVLLLGCPRPGFQQLADYMADVPIDNVRNHGDLVTTVPFSIPGFPFTPVAPYTDQVVYPPPPKTDPWGLLRFHHISLYESALASR